jgi:chromosome segregation ATPase
MDTLSLLLSPAALAVVGTLFSMSIVVRSMAGYSRQATGLQARLREIGVDLERLRSGVPELRAVVDKLRQQVLPLKDMESRMRGYYGRVQSLHSEQQRKEKEAQEEASGSIQIHRPGIPGL